MKLDLRKIYRFETIEHGASTPFPAGGDVFYECAMRQCHRFGAIHPGCLRCGNLSGNKGAITFATGGEAGCAAA